MLTIKLTNGITDNDQYKAFKFPGGEIHIKFKIDFSSKDYEYDDFYIITRLNSSDDIMLLVLTVDTLKKDWPDRKINVFIPYMPYMQADRDFSTGECFSLKTITNIFNALPVDRYTLYDPHSEVSPGLLKNCRVVDNSSYISSVMLSLPENVVLLSPDAGAYKKIYKLADKIKFKGEVASANKSRSISSGNIDSIELSKQDFEGKDVLIVDDICIGGRTFVELAKKLKERNVGKLYLAVSHGIFSNGFTELSQYFERLFTTNSRKDEYIPKDHAMLDESFVSVYNIFE